ncbi:MAG: hypothetical protein ACOC3W_00365 [Thermodesulfobacteriota bacterium]
MLGLPFIAESAEVKKWYDALSPQWGGHLRTRGYAGRPDDESVYDLVGARTYYDGSLEFRLKNKLFFEDWGILETHYEAFLNGGDTREKGRELESRFPNLFDGGFEAAGVQPVEDDRRLLDLTETLGQDDGHILYHRLDRLVLTMQPKWGTVRLGRQALTWGNGMLFNPMDLFNPFAPTDVDRDYKIGDDMAVAQFSLKELGEFQVLYVPRRNPASGDVEWDSSAAAGKFHFFHGSREFDLMIARNYENLVFGAGALGYLGSTAWRISGTWTFLPEESETDRYLSLVANLDYSWVWWERNWYGFLEFFYNGLGENDYTEALGDPDLIRALDRGEIFTLGRIYLAGHVNLEVHPLVNLLLTGILNFTDPSLVLQPRGVWSVTQDLDLMVGATLFIGGPGTEYGGFDLPGTDFQIVPADNAYVWLTWYF